MDVAWPRIDIRGVTGGAEWQVCVSQRHLDRYVGRDAFSCQCPFKDAPLLGYVMRPRLHGREWSLTVPRSEQKDRGETQGGAKVAKTGTDERQNWEQDLCVSAAQYTEFSRPSVLLLSTPYSNPVQFPGHNEFLSPIPYCCCGHKDLSCPIQMHLVFWTVCTAM